MNFVGCAQRTGMMVQFEVAAATIEVSEPRSLLCYLCAQTPGVNRERTPRAVKNERQSSNTHHRTELSLAPPLGWHWMDGWCLSARRSNLADQPRRGPVSRAQGGVGWLAFSSCDPDSDSSSCCKSRIPLKRPLRTHVALLLRQWQQADYTFTQLVACAAVDVESWECLLSSVQLFFFFAWYSFKISFAHPAEQPVLHFGRLQVNLRMTSLANLRKPPLPVSWYLTCLIRYNMY